MATFSSFGEFGDAVQKMGTDLERESRLTIAREMGNKAQQVAEREASADLGGDPKFSGWAPRLDTQLKQIATGIVMMPTRTSAGPWTVAQFGRHQGNAGGFSGPGINRKTGTTSRTKSGGLRKVRKTKGKRWNGVTKGKGTADRAFAQIENDVEPIANKGTRKIIARRFDVT
jgi:hypothetical protein